MRLRVKVNPAERGLASLSINNHKQYCHTKPFTSLWAQQLKLVKKKSDLFNIYQALTTLLIQKHGLLYWVFSINIWNKPLLTIVGNASFSFPFSFFSSHLVHYPGALLGRTRGLGCWSRVARMLGGVTGPIVAKSNWISLTAHVWWMLK